jgi:hypothetical protein
LRIHKKKKKKKKKMMQQCLFFTYTNPLPNNSFNKKRFNAPKIEESGDRERENY